LSLLGVAVRTNWRDADYWRWVWNRLRFQTKIALGVGLLGVFATCGLFSADRLTARPDASRAVVRGSVARNIVPVVKKVRLPQRPTVAVAAAGVEQLATVVRRNGHTQFVVDRGTVRLRHPVGTHVHAVTGHVNREAGIFARSRRVPTRTKVVVSTRPRAVTSQQTTTDQQPASTTQAIAVEATITTAQTESQPTTTRQKTTTNTGTDAQTETLPTTTTVTETTGPNEHAAEQAQDHSQAGKPDHGNPHGGPKQ
jgi:hypothetical protein